MKILGWILNIIGFFFSAYGIYAYSEYRNYLAQMEKLKMNGLLPIGQIMDAVGVESAANRGFGFTAFIAISFFAIGTFLIYKKSSSTAENKNEISDDNSIQEDQPIKKENTQPTVSHSQPTNVIRDTTPTPITNNVSATKALAIAGVIMAIFFAGFIYYQNPAADKNNSKINANNISPSSSEPSNPSKTAAEVRLKEIFKQHCENPIFSQILTNTKCATKDISISDMTNDKYLPEDQKSNFVKYRESANSLNINIREYQSKFTESSSHQNSHEYYKKIGDFSNEQNDIALYEGKITWGEYNKRRKEIFTASLNYDPSNSATATPVAAPAVIATTDNSPFAPSFDCEKATTGTERLICSDRELSKLDVDLNQAYMKAREKSSDKDSLKKEQIAWIKNTFRACSDKKCLTDVMSARITALK